MITMDVNMDFLQMTLILLILLVGFAAGLLVNNLWKNSRNFKIGKKPAPTGTDNLHYGSIWNNSQMGLLLTNETGEILSINPFLRQSAEITANPSKRVSVGDLFKAPGCKDVFHFLLLPRLREETNRGVFVNLNIACNSSAKEFGVFASWVPAENGTESNILLAFLDVPIQLKNDYDLGDPKQQAEEVKKLKANFLSNMSHEIRTPLNGIMGSTANIILQHTDDQNLVEQLEIILQSGERLLNTINNILDMSRIVSNKMELKLEKTQINDFLSLILIPYKSFAIKKGLLLTLKHETRALTAKIDKRYFELIVTNIVENAIKYSDSGLIKITLRSDQKCLYICVEDNGIGISEGYINRLFNPFEQESIGYDREFEGSGIGLTITKNLVDLLSGEIRITSKKGQGTVVSVVLPLLESEEPVVNNN